ncbi:MAG: NYN domain-containing protein, partial [Alphaproteobacteria bacterium]|nr:NYN domain-containing protein [Alphaproteobacteria bacterium]
SQPPMVSDDLRRQADFFMELLDLAPSIMRAHDEQEAAQLRRAQRESLRTEDVQEDAEEQYGT